MTNYNENNYDYPTITEKFASKLKNEKENARRLNAAPSEISAAVREVMAKNRSEIITATPARVYEAVLAELELLRGKKCA